MLANRAVRRMVIEVVEDELFRFVEEPLIGKISVGVVQVGHWHLSFEKGMGGARL